MEPNCRIEYVLCDPVVIAKRDLPNCNCPMRLKSSMDAHTWVRDSCVPTEKELHGARLNEHGADEIFSHRALVPNEPLQACRPTPAGVHVPASPGASPVDLSSWQPCCPVLHFSAFRTTHHPHLRRSAAPAPLVKLTHQARAPPSPLRRITPSPSTARRPATPPP